MNISHKGIWAFLLTGLIIPSAASAWPWRRRPLLPKNDSAWKTFKDYYGPEITSFTVPAALTFYFAHTCATDIQFIRKELENARKIKTTWELNSRYPFTFQEVRAAYAIADKTEEELSAQRKKEALPTALAIGAICAFYCLVVRHADHTHVGIHGHIGGGGSSWCDRPASSSFVAW